jgi:hypothetical protein
MADFSILRVFWTEGKKAENTRVLEGQKLAETLDLWGFMPKKSAHEKRHF